MSKFDWKVLDRNYEDVIYETYNGIAKSRLIAQKCETHFALKP